MDMQSPPFTISVPGDKRYFGQFNQYPDDSDSEEQQIDRSHYKDFTPTPRLQHIMPTSYGAILEPHENDVLMGRGGRNNQHSGNEMLRQLARAQKENYRNASKKEKSAISRLLVRQMHELNPPARFLKKIQDPSVWEEVSDETAREKASQVLRDAVGGLLEPKDENESVVPLPTVSAPTSLDEQDHSARTRRRRVKEEMHYEHSPSFGALPQPEPALASKRRRYSEGAGHYYHTSDVAYMPYPEQHSTAVPVGYSPLRRHSEESYRTATHSDPTGHRTYYYHQSQPPYYHYGRHYQPADNYAAHHTRSHSGSEFAHPAQSNNALIGDINQSLNVSETVNEFDLFNGELLESDVEGEDPALSGSYNRNVRR